MDKKNFASSMGIILAAGSLWGVIEFGAGLGLQKCATLLTGAVLTGLSFFWLSFVWSATRRLLPLLLVAMLAMLFKWLDALLLGVAWNHGSVLNPMFAFITALAGFALLAALFRKPFTGRLGYRMMIGAGAGLIAMCLFPLVKFFSGSPACTYAATNIPLSVYTAPVAAILAMVTVPLGYKAAGWFQLRNARSLEPGGSRWVPLLWSPALFIACVLIMVMVRTL